MSENFRTDDLNVAAFLLASGHRFTGLKTNAEPGHYFFGFEDVDGKMREAALGFFNDALVPVKSFADSKRHLVALIKRTKVENSSYERHRSL